MLGEQAILTRLSPDALPFAAIDITAGLTRVPAGEPISLQIESPFQRNNRYWAMISLTNNRTQEVTVISPR